MSYGWDDDDGDDPLNQAIVIDNGTGVMKAGLSGSEKPKAMFASVVGVPKYKMLMMGQARAQSRYVGESCKKYQGILKLNYPMEHGVINNWEDMTALWDFTYEKVGLPSHEHPVLLTEAPINPTSNRKKMAEIFFEKFNAPALSVAPQAILSLYASGRTTGVVLDAGHGVSHSVPVFEGFALPHAITRMDIAGADVTEYLALLLKKSGFQFHTSAEMETVRDIKETICRVAFHQDVLKKDDTNEPETPYTLPDGTKIKIGSAKYKAPEVLFNPMECVGAEYDGIHNVIANAVRKSDLDLRRTLYQHIVLSGGSTCFQGFGDRILHELKSVAPRDIKIRIFAPEDRKITTWVGGSIMASLQAFKSLWITKRKFQDYGPSILYRMTL